MKTKYVFLLLISGVVLSASTANAQFGGAVWQNLTSDTLSHFISQDPIAATPAGLHITYAKSRGPGAGWEIYYRFIDYYGAWDDPVIVEQSVPAYAPSISAREFATFKIGVFFDAGGDIYGDINSSPWEVWNPVNYTNTPDPDYNVTSAVDLEGTMHMSWITETGGEYKIAYGSVGVDSFSMEIIQASELGDYGSGAAPFIAVVDSVPHIFYRGVTFVNYRIHHASRLSPDSSWQIESLYSPNLDDYVAGATVDHYGDIHLSVSGNDGWGMPAHIYYMRRSYQTGNWSAPELVSGAYSVVDGHIGITEDGVVFIAGAGVSGNIYTGDIYLSENSGGSFMPEFLVNYPDGTRPALAFMPGPVGALIMRGVISYPGYDNEEIIYYGPQGTSTEFPPSLPHSIIACANYPNPFNSGTVIYVRGISASNPQVKIYDILGRKITELSPYNLKEHEIMYEWDGTDNEGTKCSSGLYFYSVDVLERKISGKMTYLR